MNRILLSLFLSLFLLLVFSQQQAGDNKLYMDEYIVADNMYYKAIAPYTDVSKEKAAMSRLALEKFKNLLPVIEKAHDDSLAFHCYYKIGALEQYFDSSVAAKQFYAKAIAFKSKLPSLSDSFLFQPFLCIGGIQYKISQFDSALINFKKAEEIAGKYPIPPDGINSLYNMLSTLHFEAGNYSYAKNYYEKAIAFLHTVTPGYSNKTLLINYQVNLAATLAKLEEFGAANTIYQELLKHDINNNGLLHNTGVVNLKSGAGHTALSFLKKVHYKNGNIAGLLNDMGRAYESINKPDSARYYYREAIQENEKWNPGQKNVQAGMTLKYLGDYDNHINSLNEALKKYQRAIIQFVNDFNETDIYKNPEQYSGVFSYINLFNTLIAKAATFERFYQKVKDTRFLKGALNTYRSVSRLADYIEKTYDSEEARLFLYKIRHTVHSKPVEASLLLYELTQQKDYIEDACMFDQRNKAAIVSLNVQGNELRSKKESRNILFEKEALLRSAITRLSLKGGQTADSTQLQTVNASIRDYEIQLTKTQDEIKDDPAYCEKQLAEHIPSVSEVQKGLDGNTALVSYHLSANELLAFIITDEKFEYSRSPVTDSFFAGIDLFKRSLHDLSPGQPYPGREVSLRLYNKIILPVLAKLPGIKRLLVIPEGGLTYLPFEALQNEKGKYLVENFSVQYLYTTALFNKADNEPTARKALAFAPFVANGYKDSAGDELASLPASKEEVGKLKGKVFTGSEATKTNFLQTANRYPVIHFATHTSINNEMPQRSFIAFYPAGNKDDKLFAQDIYNLDLDSTRLIILSACETGGGQLIRGDGLMSISRAFAYAGCPNIITSLWKTEGKTTSFITKRLYYYLDKGLTKDNALQKAKLDFLNSPEIEPRFKTPNYWAHLIYIGQYEPVTTSWLWWLTIGSAVVSALLIIILPKLKQRRNRYRLSMLD